MSDGRGMMSVKEQKRQDVRTPSVGTARNANELRFQDRGNFDFYAHKAKQAGVILLENFLKPTSGKFLGIPFAKYVPKGTKVDQRSFELVGTGRAKDVTLYREAATA